MNLYLSRDGSVEGPYSLEALKGRLDSGEFTGAEDVCPVGEDAWISLSDALARPQAAVPPQIPRAYHAVPRDAKRSGCKVGCTSVLLTIIVLCLVLVFVFNRVVWHSAVPYKILARLVCKDSPNITIKGIQGSISEGASIQYFSYTDEEGNTSFLEEAGFRHNPLRQILTGKKFILYNVEVKRGHFFVSSFTDSNETADDETSGDGDADDADTENGETLDLFEIRNVSIADMVIEARDTGAKFELTMLHLDGFKIEDGKFEMGELVLKSNVLDLEIPPATSTLVDGESERLDLTFTGNLKPDLIEAMAENIPFAGTFTVVGKKLVRADLIACDDAFKASMQDDGVEPAHFTLRAEDLRIRSYAPGVMLDHISGTVRIEEMPEQPGTVRKGGAADMKKATNWSEVPSRLTVTGGAFHLGSAAFVCDPLDQVLTPPREEPVQLRARAAKGGSTYLLTVTVAPDEAGDDASVQLSLTSTPEKALRDILGNLLYDATYAELPVENQQTVEWHEGAFLGHLFERTSDPSSEKEALPKGGK